MDIMIDFPKSVGWTCDIKWLISYIDDYVLSKNLGVK
jgi:hypothetical protein